jgi:mono/diheme cytochrome c family protein
VLLALSALQKTGIALSGAAFIVFAVASALLIPRFKPDFPGRGVRVYSGICILFAIGMLGAIVGFGHEKQEKRAEASTPAATSTPSPSPAPPSPSPSPAPAPSGDAVAGKALFAANGCASCHTFRPAGATGKVGPDLDNVAADAQKANRGTVQQYAHESIADPNAYVVPGFPKGVMPPFAGLGTKKIDDLVAFVTQGS